MTIHVFVDCLDVYLLLVRISTCLSAWTYLAFLLVKVLAAFWNIACDSIRIPQICKTGSVLAPMLLISTVLVRFIIKHPYTPCQTSASHFAFIERHWLLIWCDCKLSSIVALPFGFNKDSCCQRCWAVLLCLATVFVG